MTRAAGAVGPARRRAHPGAGPAARSGSAVRLPDRQRGPAGRGDRDPAGHQLLRRGQRAAQLPRHQDHHAERQRSRVRRQRGPVHRPGEVSRLDAHHGCRPRHLLQEPGALGGPGEGRHQEPRDRLDADRPFARLHAGREGRARYDGDVRDRPADHPVLPERHGRTEGRAVRHRRRPGAAQGRRPHLRRRQGHRGPERLRLPLRLPPPRYRPRRRRQPGRWAAGASRPRCRQLLDHGQPDRPEARGQGAHLSARQGQRQGRQQGLGAGGGHHRPRREPPQAGSDARLG